MIWSAMSQVKRRKTVQYGDYGRQPRDNAATITADEQQAQTSEIILGILLLF